MKKSYSVKGLKRKIINQLFIVKNSEVAGYKLIIILYPLKGKEEQKEGGGGMKRRDEKYANMYYIISTLLTFHAVWSSISCITYTCTSYMMTDSIIITITRVFTTRTISIMRTSYNRNKENN